MSGIKRFTPDGAYWFQGGECMDEDKDGQFVKYTDYMTLLREYAEERAILIASLRLIPQFVTLDAARDFVRDKLEELK